MVPHEQTQSIDFGTAISIDRLDVDEHEALQEAINLVEASISQDSSDCPNGPHCSRKYSMTLLAWS
jgi:hypothetical protein